MAMKTIADPTFDDQIGQALHNEQSGPGHDQFGQALHKEPRSWRFNQIQLNLYRIGMCLSIEDFRMCLSIQVTCGKMCSLNHQKQHTLHRGIRNA